MNEQTLKNVKLKRMLTVGLALLMLLIVVIGTAMKLSSNTLILDVNPSIEIKTNGLRKVTEVNPLNEDGENLLKEYKIKDRDVEDVVESLIDLMILKGYITGGKDNMVMITVDDEKVNKEMVDKVNKAIAAYLENRQLEAAVVSQRIDMEDDDFKLAREKGISPGKLNIIDRLLSSDKSLTYEELESISLKDLILALDKMDIELEELFDDYIETYKVSDDDFYEYDDDHRDDKDDKDDKGLRKPENKGTPKTKVKVKTIDKAAKDNKKEPVKKEKTNNNEIIGADKAKSIALGLAKGKITDFELDEDDGRLKYEIEIKAKNGEHEIEIDAYTGEVIEHEVDDDDDWDNDDWDDDRDDD